jgi:hypothetical protein
MRGGGGGGQVLQCIADINSETIRFKTVGTA